jgi:hypothetical protein
MDTRPVVALSSGRSPQIGAPGRATGKADQSTRCLGGLQRLVEQGEDLLLSFLFIHVVRHVLELPTTYPMYRPANKVHEHSAT